MGVSGPPKIPATEALSRLPPITCRIGLRRMQEIGCVSRNPVAHGVG